MEAIASPTPRDSRFFSGEHCLKEERSAVLPETRRVESGTRGAVEIALGVAVPGTRGSTALVSPEANEDVCYRRHGEKAG
jgi:hypothetical protein